MIRERGKPLVSIIILTYNSLKFIEKCLESVLNTNYEKFEIVIVDNGSTDGTVELIQKRFGEEEKIKLIVNRENVGFAEGNNVGAKFAKGKYIVFLNADTIVDPNWINEVVKVMENNPDIGVCQSKLLLMDKPEFFDSAGDFIDKYGVMMRRGGDIPEKDIGQYDRVEEIFSARGAAMIIRKDLFEEIGGFDTMYFLTYEDIDLCWRARLNGHKIFFVPKSIVYHKGGFSLLPEKAFLTTRNWLLTLIKNYETWNMFKIMPNATVIAFFSALFEILTKRSPILFWKRIKALLWILFNFKKIWVKRLTVQSYIRKVSDREIMKVMLNRNLAITYWPKIWFNIQS